MVKKVRSSKSQLELSKHLFPEMIETINYAILEAADSWAAIGQPSFGHNENHYSAALVGQLQKVFRQRRMGLRAIPESHQFDEEILLGLKDPDKSPRVDIEFIGKESITDRGYLVECKRIGTSELHRKYVDDGISRFRSGKYSSEVRVAGMIGFNIGADESATLEEINEYIVLRLNASRAETLTHHPSIADSRVHLSVHKRPELTHAISLCHVHIPVQAKS